MPAFDFILPVVSPGATVRHTWQALRDAQPLDLSALTVRQSFYRRASDSTPLFVVDSDGTGGVAILDSTTGQFQSTFGPAQLGTLDTPSALLWRLAVIDGGGEVTELGSGYLSYGVGSENAIAPDPPTSGYGLSLLFPDASPDEAVASAILAAVSTPGQPALAALLNLLGPGADQSSGGAGSAVAGVLAADIAPITGWIKLGNQVRRVETRQTIRVGNLPPNTTSTIYLHADAATPLSLTAGSGGLPVRTVTTDGMQATAFGSPPAQPLGSLITAAGGTFTGLVTLAEDPQSALDAATKQYVDAQAGGVGADALLKSANLSDLPNAGTSRTNLGLGTAAVQPTSAFLQPANNLEDVANVGAALANLGAAGLSRLSRTQRRLLTLAISQLAFDTDGNRLWVGDGATAGGVPFIGAADNSFADPHDFGAVGDGSADDTIPLQQALASGRHVILRPGKTYQHQAGLQMLAGQHLYGHGAILKRCAQPSAKTTAAPITLHQTSFTLSDVTGLRVGMQLVLSQGVVSALNAGTNFSTVQMPITAINGNVVTVGGGGSGLAFASGTVDVHVAFHQVITADDCEVRGLKLNGNKANWTWAKWETTQGISLDGDRVLIDHCYLHDMPSEGILLENGAYTSVVNCDFQNLNGNGVHLSLSQPTMILGCRFLNCNLGTDTHENGCVASSAFTADTVVANCWMNGGQAGIGGFNTADDSDQLFINNVIRNMTTDGIDAINSAGNVFISGNKIYNCPVGIHVFGDAAGKIKISNNQIFSCADAADVGGSASSYLEFVGNSIYGGSVTLQSFSFGRCNGNLIQGGKILVNGAVSYSQIIGNQIDLRGDTTTTTGIDLFGLVITELIVAENMISGGAVGISSSQAGVTGLKITGNHLTGQISRAINLGFSGDYIGCGVTDNHIENAAGSISYIGILCFSNQVYLSNNRVSCRNGTGAALEGILVSAAGIGVVVDGNRVAGQFSVGTIVLGGSTTFVRCKRNYVTKLPVDQGSNNTVTDNDLIPSSYIQPNTIVNLSLWLKDTGFFQDTGLTTPAALDTDPVGGWADQSGAAVVAAVTQATAGNRPLLKLAIQNGRRGVLFNGSTQYLIGNALAVLMTGEDKPYTIAMAIKPAVGDQNTYWDFSNSGSANAILRGTGASGVYSGSIRDDALSATKSYSSFAQDGTAHVVIWTSDGQNAQCFRDGVGGLVTDANVGTLTLNQFEIGRFTQFASQFLNGLLFEVVFWPRQLTGTERQNVQDYLSFGWAI